MTDDTFRAIANWDAILAAEPVIYVPVGDRPRGAVSRSKGVFLRRGMEVAFLSGSENLASSIRAKPILIIVEADERTCRITRIPHMGP